jgi:hypothetical protein
MTSIQLRALGSFNKLAGSCKLKDVGAYGGAPRNKTCLTHLLADELREGLKHR